MKVRHQQRARRPSAPTDLQTEMSDDEGSGNGWSGARLTNATTAALVRTYRGTSFLPEDRRFKPLVLSLLRGTEGSNPSPSSGESGTNRRRVKKEQEHADPKPPPDLKKSYQATRLRSADQRQHVPVGKSVKDVLGLAPPADQTHRRQDLQPR